MTILVAIDDVVAAEPVIRTALRLGAGLDEELYVAHLVHEEQADRDAEAIRTELAERLDGEPVEATVALEYINRLGTREGPRIAHELLEIAADVDITHIVMGHESKGFGSRLRSGDVAFEVVDKTAVPVTVVSLDD